MGMLHIGPKHKLLKKCGNISRNIEIRNVDVIKEVIKEVVKFVEVPIETIKEVEKIVHVNVPYEVVKTIEVIKHIEIPIEVEKEVVKYIDVPHNVYIDRLVFKDKKFIPYWVYGLMGVESFIILLLLMSK